MFVLISLLAGLLTCLRDVVFQCPKELEVIESVVSSVSFQAWLSLSLILPVSDTGAT